MKVETRGKFRTLVHDDGAPVTARCRATVHVAPRLSGGKTYATLALGGGCPPVFGAVDAMIKELVPDLAYSPLLAGGRLLVIKIAPTALAEEAGVGETVEVHLKLGNFGSFGYCWVASNFFKAQGNEYGL